jgi:hypothetical protein
MISFQKIWENIQSSKEKSLDSKEMSAIRTGLGIDANFWDNFLLVINNSEGLSELLDVPEMKILNWGQKIKQVLDQVKDVDGSPVVHDKQKLLKTGYNNESQDCSQQH